LATSEIGAICAGRELGFSVNELADLFGISQSYASRITRRQRGVARAIEPQPSQMLDLKHQLESQRAYPGSVAA
jgi:predicted transcriptional regulator